VRLSSKGVDSASQAKVLHRLAEPSNDSRSSSAKRYDRSLSPSGVRSALLIFWLITSKNASCSV
jgi:hypothetical protein